MSNAIAIAAVTSTLCDLLANVHGADSVLSDTDITAKPLDTARAAEDHNQLNLFLYQTVINAAWRNMDMPQKTQRGETGQPPLPLNLYYLLTAYGRQTDEILAHRLMGRAMSLLHDNAVLLPQLLQQTLANHTEVTGEDLYLQQQGVRLTLQPLSVDDISKLWTVFHTKYRLSVAYQVSVVLIESTRPSRTPLPVLRRGADDRGVQVQVGFALPYPALAAVGLPNQQPAARVGVPISLLPAGTLTDQAGDLVTLSGSNLTGDGLNVNLTHALLTQSLDHTGLQQNTASTISFLLPTTQTDWPAGLYSVSIGRRDAGSPMTAPVRTTNTLAFPVAPQILSFTPDSPSHASITQITVNFSPQVWPNQSVSLLVGDHSFPAPAIGAKTGQLIFSVASLPAGAYFLRLRVDGVDSLIITYGAGQLAFDTNQQLVLT